MSEEKRPTWAAMSLESRRTGTDAVAEETEFSRRLELDNLMAEKRLENELKEAWDE